jgi:hypothetical protein
MTGRVRVRGNHLLVGVPLLAVACSSAGQGPRATLEPPTSAAPARTPSEAPSRGVYPRGIAEGCPVTLPRAVGPPGVSPDEFFGWGSSYGSRPTAA